MATPSLTIVGTGIQAAGQLTIAARNSIEQAEKLLYLVTEPIAKTYLHSLNSTAESLEGFYAEGKDRFLTYMQMVDRIMDEVHAGRQVCVAFYGHPGVFVLPAHVAMRRAREEGIYARMLPGISAEDCLFADLGIDPALPGCQSFEATDFLIRKRIFDVRCSLILWQIGVLGLQTYENENYVARHLDVLADYLSQFYGPTHTAILYEAPAYPMFEPVAEPVAVGALVDAPVSPISTLYVPPKSAAVQADQQMLERLGMDQRAIHSLDVKLYATRRAQIEVVVS